MPSTSRPRHRPEPGWRGLERAGLPLDEQDHRRWRGSGRDWTGRHHRSASPAGWLVGEWRRVGQTVTPPAPRRRHGRRPATCWVARAAPIEASAARACSCGRGQALLRLGQRRARIRAIQAHQQVALLDRRTLLYVQADLTRAPMRDEKVDRAPLISPQSLPWFLRRACSCIRKRVASRPASPSTRTMRTDGNPSHEDSPLVWQSASCMPGIATRFRGGYTQDCKDFRQHVRFFDGKNGVG